MRAHACGVIASRSRIERRERAWHRQYDIDPVVRYVQPAHAAYYIYRSRSRYERREGAWYSE